MLPYVRLSTFYFVYFASLGALLPYWGLYLQSLGFSAREIGELMAIIMVTKIVSPNIWGWLADRSGQRMRVIRLGSLASLLTFVAIFYVSSYTAVALVMLLFSFFWNATLPQFEAVTLGYLQEGLQRYSAIRLWGSVGFIVAVALLAPLLDYFGINLLIPVLTGIYLAIFLCSLAVKERPQEPVVTSETPLLLRQVLRRPEVVALLVMSFLMQAGHGPYYSFYTLYMEGFGYSRTLVGQLWALGVVVEVVIFLFMHRLIPRYGLYRLLIASLLLTLLRWLLIALWPDSLLLMLLAQTLHAASFGIFHAVTITLFHQAFPGRLQGRGQAIYSSISYGAGGALGALLSGYVGEYYSLNAIYLMAALLTLMALLVAWRWLDDIAVVGGRVGRYR
ncbi:MAG: MFS transporter [Gammaproteobacteria bacterium]|nr:MFS transporter [Gammaproteobacteria bacterium]